MGMNVSIEGSNPSFSVKRAEAAQAPPPLPVPASETALSDPAATPVVPSEEGGPRGKHGFPREASLRAERAAKRRGRDLNPRRTFQHVRDFQSRSLGHSDTSPGRGSAYWTQRARFASARGSSTIVLRRAS